MSQRDKNFLSLLVCLVVLASCSKTTPSETTNTGSDTKQAEEQLLNDLNQVIESVESENTTASWTNVSTPAPTQSGSKNMEPALKVGEPADLLKNTPGLTPNTKVDSKTLKLNQSYTSPGWKDEVEFTVALDGKVIRSVTVKTIKGGDITKKLQAAFGSAINTVIAWKTIEEAKNIATVWGASLTTQAFISAIKSM